jgi:hypothetical protein
MSGTRSHRPDQDDASAQSDLICVPQPIIVDQVQAAQIGGSGVSALMRLDYAARQGAIRSKLPDLSGFEPG